MSTNSLKKINLKSTLSVGLDVSKAKINICFLNSEKDTFS